MEKHKRKPVSIDEYEIPVLMSINKEDKVYINCPLWEKFNAIEKGVLRYITDSFLAGKKTFDELEQELPLSKEIIEYWVERMGGAKEKKRKPAKKYRYVKVRKRIG